MAKTRSDLTEGPNGDTMEVKKKLKMLIKITIGKEQMKKYYLQCLYVNYQSIFKIIFILTLKSDC